MQEPLVTRLTRFRNLMAGMELEAFLVSVPENRYYLSGYEADDTNLTESSGHLLITATEQFLLTDFRYQEEAARESPDFQLLVYTDGLAGVLPELFAGSAVKQLGVEGHYLTHESYLQIEKAMAAVRPKGGISNVKGLIEGLRVVKEPTEIDRIRASLELTEKTMNTVWTMLRPGLTERELAWKIEVLIREGGGEAVSFPPIVAAGPNAALPHAVPTERKISRRDGVILDLGSKLNHYCSDMTRTWTAGAPEAKIREIYRIVREAQLAAQHCIRAGVNAAEVDKAARELITRAGYGDYFGHGLGHGVGLAVHEEPRLRRKSETVLEENMVVTVEPGIYLSGIGGVRLENMIRVTSTGHEVLNQAELFYPWQL